MPQATVDAVTKYHTTDQDLMFHHTLFIPYCGWVEVYEHGNKICVAFVKAGPGTKVQWSHEVGPANLPLDSRRAK